VTYADQGDYKKASECFLDAIEMGTLIPHHNSLIGWLVGMACENIGRRGLWEITDKLDVTTAKMVVLRLKQISEKRERLSDALQMEKVVGQREIHKLLSGSPQSIAEQFQMYCYSDEENESRESPSTTSGSWGATGITLWVGKTETIKEHKQFMGIIAENADSFYGKNKKLPNLRSPINAILLPVFEESIFKRHQLETDTNLLVTYISVQSYKKENTKYPEDLELLSLGKFAIDNFSGIAQKPFAYKKKSDGTFLLYSIGPDGIDNNGIPITPNQVDPPYKGKKLGPLRHPIKADAKGDIVPRINTD
jgi:hypothetical protein